MAISLLKKYSTLGISLHIATTKKLCYKAPRGAITIDIMQEIKAHKAEIIICLYQQQIQHLDLPEPWKLALKKTAGMDCPNQINRERWEAIQNQVHLWIFQDLPQLQKIIANGWLISDIFGCHETHPQARRDYMGLLMLMAGNAVIQVTMGAIRLRTTSGAEQSFFKNVLDRPETTLIYSLETDALSASLLPRTGGVVVERITTVIDEAGLKNSSRWIKPTGNNPTGSNLNLKLGERTIVTKSAISSIPTIKSDDFNAASFIANLKKSGVFLSAANEELNVYIASNPTISAETIMDMLMYLKTHVSDHKEKILEYLLI